MSKPINLACLQLNSSAEVGDNLSTVARMLESAQAIDLLLLPENFAQMPRHRRQQHVESEESGLVQKTLSTLAKENGVTIVAGSLAVRHDAESKPFARCLVFDSNGHRCGQYDKLHLFDVDVDTQGGQRYRESNTYEAGALVPAQIQPVPIKIGGSTLQLGLTICYDLRFPELFRKLAINGAQLICVPSAFTYKTGQAHWRTLLRARAIENQVFVAAPAQWGKHENGRETWGHSMIIDPWGNVIAEKASGEGLVYAEIDPTQIELIRTKFPVHQHRRLD